MARPCKRTAELELSGAWNPQRKRDREGKPVADAPIGLPPGHLSAPARAPTVKARSLSLAVLIVGLLIIIPARIPSAAIR
jgi:hypothetical protein